MSKKIVVPFNNQTMKYCLYPGCPNAYFSTLSNEVQKKQFFQFPEDNQTRELWRSICQLSSSGDYRKGNICEDHFLQTDFRGDDKKLKEGTCPIPPLLHTSLGDHDYCPIIGYNPKYLLIKQEAQKKNIVVNESIEKTLNHESQNINSQSNGNCAISINVNKDLVPVQSSKTTSSKNLPDPNNRNKSTPIILRKVICPTALDLNHPTSESVAKTDGSRNKSHSKTRNPLNKDLKSNQLKASIVAINNNKNGTITSYNKSIKVKTNFQSASKLSKYKKDTSTDLVLVQPYKTYSNKNKNASDPKLNSNDRKRPMPNILQNNSKIICATVNGGDLDHLSSESVALSGETFSDNHSPLQMDQDCESNQLKTDFKSNEIKTVSQSVSKLNENKNDTFTENPNLLKTILLFGAKNKEDLEHTYNKPNNGSMPNLVQSTSKLDQSTKDSYAKNTSGSQKSSFKKKTLHSGTKNNNGERKIVPMRPKEATLCPGLVLSPVTNQSVVKTLSINKKSQNLDLNNSKIVGTIIDERVEKNSLNKPILQSNQLNAMPQYIVKIGQIKDQIFTKNQALQLKPQLSNSETNWQAQIALGVSAADRTKTTQKHELKKNVSNASNPSSTGESPYVRQYKLPKKKDNPLYPQLRRTMTQLCKVKKSLRNAKEQLKIHRSKRKDVILNELICDLNEVCQDFIRAQVRNGNVVPAARRWTTRDKQLFCNLYTISPKAYRFLACFFTCPSKTVVKTEQRRLLSDALAQPNEDLEAINNLNVIDDIQIGDLETLETFELC